MNASRFRVLSLASLLLALPLASGCIINAGDGDDDGADDGATDGDDQGGEDQGESDDQGNESQGESESDDEGSADDTGSPGGADTPAEGTWLYSETGNTTNDCDFIEEPTNGWGEYRVEHDGDGFRVVPGDETAPFDCNAGDGQFECPERLQDEMSEGGSTLRAFVQVVGTLPDEDQMLGTQQGRIECEGADCGLAEQVLGTSFPCSFSVEFTGERL